MTMLESKTNSHASSTKCTYLLRTLLLCEHFLLLCHNLGLVLQAESQGQSHEESAGSDDPNEVSDEFSSGLEETRGLGETRGDVLAGCWRDNVDERS